MVDCGANMSCISEHLASHHDLPGHFKDIPISLMAVDDQPIASGQITQYVLVNISESSHSDTQALTVVAVRYLVILGLWAESHLTLNCCGLSPANLIKVYANGFDPLLQPVLSALCSILVVGLGLGPSGPILLPSHYVPPTSPPLPSAPSTPSKPCTLFLSALVGTDNFGCSTPSPLDLSAPKPPEVPNVRVVSPKNSTCLVKGKEVCYLCFHDSSSPFFIKLFGTDPPPPEPDGSSASAPSLDSLTDSGENS